MKNKIYSIALIIISLSVLLTSCKKESTDPNAPKVGDFYYSDNTFSSGDAPQAGKNCIGIVFSNNYGEHKRNLIVSLDETASKWCINDTIIKKNSKTDGLKNMEIIQAIDKWDSIFVAFKWAADRGDGWYLPAKEELLALYNTYKINKEKFNSKLIVSGGTPIDNEWYWSSSEHTKKYSWAVSFSYGGSTSIGRVYPDNKIRAIKVVQ